jgi:pimeloyl-ACP methyl ester carboxylesterase
MAGPVLPRGVRRGLVYGAGIALSAPRTLAFVGSEVWRSRRGDADGPPFNLSPALVAQVAVDELIVALMSTPGRYPRRADYERAREEILAADDLFKRRGWVNRPRTHFADPGVPQSALVMRERYMGAGWEHLVFPSNYDPDPEHPGRERWLAYEPNRNVHASMLRVRGEPQRPWIVCLHPFGTGYPQLDAFSFRAVPLRREAALNVVLPALPLHGPRRIGRMSGDGFMTPNVVDIGHGLAQSVWVVRRLLAWIRSQGGKQIALYGASLGAHVASLVASLEPDLSCVIAGVPTSDIAEIFIRHTPRRLRERAAEYLMSGEEARRIHRVVSPLAHEPAVAHERRFIFAASGDRMAGAEQAHDLWRHWGEPEIAWFDQNHIAFLFSGGVARFVRRALEKSFAT